MPSILIVPIRPVDHAELAALVSPLARIFGGPVSIEETTYIDPSFAFDTYRNQYNSTSLIGSLLEHIPDYGGKIIGVTTADLFVPVLTYVFGEAQLDGRAAVLSTHRFKEEFYGLAANPELELSRLVKEAVHELGHAFGLVHCQNPECVMHSSTSAEEIDLKGKNFCEACEATMWERQQRQVS
jgi:archaemetzincin